MLILECADCDGRFAEFLADIVEDREPFEFWGQIGTHVSYVKSCPYCGGTELEEVKPPKTEELEIE